MSIDKKLPNPKLGELGIPHQFTSEKQPSPEAKSKGAKKAWEYRKARQLFAEQLSNMEMPDGNKVNFWEEAAKMVFAEILAKGSTLKAGAKLHFLTKLMNVLPKDDSLTVDFNNPPKLLVEIIKTKVEQDKAKEDSETKSQDDNNSIDNDGINE